VSLKPDRAQLNAHIVKVFFDGCLGLTRLTSQPSKKPDDDSVGLAPFLERSNNHFGQSKSDVSGQNWREKSRSKEPNQCTQDHKPRQ
jgi:hypothetical protein